MKRLSLLLALFLVPALACSTTGITERLVPPGGVLYQDIFSNSESGWGELSVAAGEANYINGAYHIVVKQPNINMWTHPGMDFANVREEVNLMPIAGPQANRMGLICRLKDDSNYYFFVISADGSYAIGKMKDGQTSLLTGDKMLHHDSILPGYQINQVRADCVDNLLTLYVNGVLVKSIKDGDFASGDVGILAGTFSEPGTDVYFDNFLAVKP